MQRLAAQQSKVIPLRRDSTLELTNGTGAKQAASSTVKPHRAFFTTVAANHTAPISSQTGRKQTGDISENDEGGIFNKGVGGSGNPVRSRRCLYYELTIYKLFTSNVT
jgi:hypothetical protein